MLQISCRNHVTDVSFTMSASQNETSENYDQADSWSLIQSAFSLDSN